MQNNLLTLSHLTVAYHYNPVIWNVTADIPKGCLGGIVGPNGAGKSTLLKTVLGFIKPTAGTIEYYNKPSIAYVPQKNSIDWTFPVTVQEVVLMGTYGRLKWYQRPSHHEYSCAQTMLELVGLADKADMHISELSGGQQQRMFLARALAQQADCFFLDEPFAAIDMISEKIIMDILRQLVKQGKTVLMVHHNIAVLEQYFDWVMILNKECLATGNPQQVGVQQALKKVYGELC